MNSTPKRILHITEMLSAAGIESFIMNVYRNIDRSKIQFDFLVLRDQKEFYDDEIASLGGKKYCIHSDIENTLLRVLEESHQIIVFLKKHHYDIVHVHYTTPLRAFYLKAAKEAGVPVRIYHSHSAAVSGKSKLKLAIYKYCQTLIDKYATDCFACSEAAAEWVFSKKILNENRVQIVHNGIDINRFLFNNSIREKIRTQLSLGNSFTIINTGRFTEQKNQSFILDIVDVLKKDRHDVKLLLLGDGPLKGLYKSKVRQLGLSDIVLFLGVKPNVQDYLSAADCYLMPSLYEGLPVAGIEAECSGLPCFFSDDITEEVRLSDQAHFLPLSLGEKGWASEVMKYDFGESRLKMADSVKNAGYDIQDVAKSMGAFYLLKAQGR